MGKAKKPGKGLPLAGRAGRAKLTTAESLARMRSFAARKEQFIAAVRKGKNRSISA